MAELLDITQGWTKQLGPFTLRNDGVPVDLTGLTVRLLLRGKGMPQFIPVSGQIQIDPDQSELGNRGQVYYKPAATDFRWDKSPYACHWEVTDQAGDVVFFPNGEADTIGVAQP
jgi:hypothetical protein